MDAKHIELIVKQCENQRVLDRPDAVARFAIAYDQARNMARVGFSPTWDQMLEWAALVEPVNAKGFRRVPVRFGWTAQGLRPELIENAMRNWYGAYKNYLLTGDAAFGHVESKFREDLFYPSGISIDQHLEFYRAFQEIHPWEDGNGRVGHLLWALSHAIRGNGWPLELPPDLWGTEG